MPHDTHGDVTRSRATTRSAARRLGEFDGTIESAAPLQNPIAQRRATWRDLGEFLAPAWPQAAAVV
jgi:hypothetical protein